MEKKAIALLLVPVLLLYLSSCVIHSVKEQEIQSVLKKENTGVDIIAVVKRDGEILEFTKKNPAHIEDNHVVGEIIGSQITLSRDEVAKRDRDPDGVQVVRTTEGTSIRTASLKRSKGDFVIEPLVGVRIPISEVDMVTIRKVNPVGTFFASIGAVAGVLAGAFVIVLLTKESCPFVYSFDGETYVFDAEPYGGATCEGFKRSEWCGLENLKEVDGEYRLRITNEVEETQFTDEIKVVVVDHAPLVRVIPDEKGRMHTVKDPESPVLARDRNGRDLRPAVGQRDWAYWQSRTEDLVSESQENLRDELIFEFPKPVDAAEGKLIFNGCNTLWASHMIKKFLELYGSGVRECYEKCRDEGPGYQIMMNWNNREELYRMHIRVETEQGWVSKGTIVGGGPFISEDRVYSLDVSDVPGNVLRVKLTPPMTFWKINYLAMDYSADEPVQASEIHAKTAVSHDGVDIRDLLARTDRAYHVMPVLGNSADLVFEAPQRMPGVERTLILKAVGYYEIHLEEKGEPRNDILTRLLMEPGFTHNFAVSEYVKWRQEIDSRVPIK